MAEIVTVYDPYQVKAILDGVQKGRAIKRPNFLQSFFGDRGLSESDSIRMDIEFNIGNPMGQPVNPDVDAPELDLPQYGHKAYGWTYVKEAVTSRSDPDFMRRIGDALNVGADPTVVLAEDFRKRQQFSLNAMENYEELVARDILVSGKHIAKSDYATTVVTDFEKSVATTSTEYVAGEWGNVDLTSITHNGGAGKAAWSATGGTKVVDPLQDLKMWASYMSRWDSLDSIVMSYDAYLVLEAALNGDLYKNARDLTINVAPEDRIYETFGSALETFEGVTLQRVLRLDNRKIPVYTYDGKYTLRTGTDRTKQSYMPNGYVLMIPTSANQVKRYGRIQHLKAQWRAMPLWINQWMNERHGTFGQEMHRALFMGLRRPDSVKSIKVI